MKKCTKCGEEKNYSEFHKHKHYKDGYRSQCKECRKVKDQEYYTNNEIYLKVKDKRKYDKRYIDYNRKYKENNKNFVNELKREWSNSLKGKEQKKKYYQNNSEKIKEKVSKYRVDNIDIIKERESKKRRSDKYKRYRSNYIKNHKIKFPHLYVWRSILRNSLKRLNGKKSSRTIDLLGYSADDLKRHIESLFKEGMSWDNYGEWHVDHIKPVSLFNVDDDISIVNSLENLQPLWAFENLSKGNKYNK